MRVSVDHKFNMNQQCYSDVGKPLYWTAWMEVYSPE